MLTRLKRKEKQGNFTGVPADINCQRNRSVVITAIVIIIESHTKKEEKIIIKPAGRRPSGQQLLCVRSLYIYTGKEYKMKKKTRLYPFPHGLVDIIYLVHIWREILG